MTDILIAVASTEGHGATIAKHLREEIEKRGRSVREVDIKGDPQQVNAVMSGPDWTSVIVIGSIHFGDYDTELFGFAKRHAKTLNNSPSAFLSVSLSAASDDMAERMAIDKIAHAIMVETGWHPDRLLHVAGAVNEDKLNFFKRGALLAVLKAKGVKPDASGFTVFTDWKQLDEFVEGFITAERAAGDGS